MLIEKRSLCRETLNFLNRVTWNHSIMNVVSISINHDVTGEKKAKKVAYNTLLARICSLFILSQSLHFMCMLLGIISQCVSAIAAKTIVNRNS